MRFCIRKQGAEHGETVQTGVGEGLGFDTVYFGFDKVDVEGSIMCENDGSFTEFDKLGIYFPEGRLVLEHFWCDAVCFLSPPGDFSIRVDEP